VFILLKNPPSFDLVLSTNVNINKEAIDRLSDGLVMIGSNIGLGISASGTAIVVASVVKGTPISPIQKVLYKNEYVLFN